MLNVFSAEFTLHAAYTWQKSFSAVYALHYIGSYITGSAVLHLCGVCMLQNPSAAFLHFYDVPCTIFYTGFELQARQNRDDMPSLVHFFDLQICIWYKNARQQTFM